MKGAKERSRLPAGMELHKRMPRPNQGYDVILDGATVGTSEHQDNWHGSKFWLFTDIDGTQKFVGEGRYYKDGAAWLKSAYQDGAAADAAPVGHGSGFETNQKRKKAVEDHAVGRIMECFPQPPYQVSNLGDRHLGFDIEVTCPDGQVWHIEAKGTRGACGTVELTEGERAHLGYCPAQGHALCVVSEIAADPVGDGFQCSGGKLEWVWPWKITEKIGEPGLVPITYRYTVPLGRYIGPVPPPPPT